MKSNNIIRHLKQGLICMIVLVMLVMLSACPPPPPPAVKDINLTVFIDLSDRIDPTNHPLQISRDTAIVSYLANWFKNQTVGKNILKTKNNFQVIFYPAPADDKVAALAKDLNCNIAEYKGVEKRLHAENLANASTQTLSQVYQLVLQNPNWIGCDIWDFFSSRRVDSYCVKKDARNLLVILTDGYLLQLNNKQQKGQQTNYINNQLLANPQFSLIANRQGLDNLEVMILEINPTNPTLKARMTEVLRTWLTDMGVKEENIAIEANDFAGIPEAVMAEFLDR